MCCCHTQTVTVSLSATSSIYMAYSNYIISYLVTFVNTFFILIVAI
nr:MAG TPA: hypothetical protein [Caudoviricetes sp.]